MLFNHYYLTFSFKNWKSKHIHLTIIPPEFSISNSKILMTKLFKLKSNNPNSRPKSLKVKWKKLN